MKSEFNQKVLKTTQWRINKEEKVNQKIDTIPPGVENYKNLGQEESSKNGRQAPLIPMVPGPWSSICDLWKRNK